MPTGGCYSASRFKPHLPSYKENSGEKQHVVFTKSRAVSICDSIYHLIYALFSLYDCQHDSDEFSKSAARRSDVYWIEKL